MFFDFEYLGLVWSEGIANLHLDCEITLYFIGIFITKYSRATHAFINPIEAYRSGRDFL